ncbi:hypothetical protein [Luedemannella helvata]|uniref:Uncharacterized protein n=1 Tax=Luedemannella helvata TaxID=349315 RepID=A0ABP4WRY4_9ACTN
MVNPEFRRRLRHVVLLVLAWVLLVPGYGEPGAVPSPAAAATSLNTAGLTVLARNVLIRPDGTRRTLTLPGGATAAFAAQVPGGWVVEGQADRVRSLYFVAPTGEPRRIGYVRGTWDVTPNGRTLVAVGVTAAPATGALDPTVSTYDLPSLRRTAQQRFAGGSGPIIAGTTNDRVLLRQGYPTPRTALAATWNLRTNTLRATTAPAWVWSLGGTGTVLRRVDQLDASKRVVGSCVDAVDATSGAIPLGMTGTCTAVARNTHGGLLSPDARWAALAVSTAANTPPAIQLVQVADLRAGRWRPVALGAGKFVQFWDTPTSMIVATIAGTNVTQQRCDTSARCTTLRLPPVAAGDVAVLVPRFG